MANEPVVPVPHRPLKRKGQLISTTPSLNVDELIALDATERDRSRPPPIASATRERHDRNHCAAALKLLPHRLTSRQLAPPRVQPSHMRSGCLTTGGRVARLAGQPLAARARPLSPAPRDVHCQRRTRTLPRQVPMLSTARAGRRPTVRAPLIQPCVAVAHDRHRALARPAWSPFFWRGLTSAGSRSRDQRSTPSANPLLLARSDSL